MALSPAVLATLERKLRSHAGLEMPAWVLEARAEERMRALSLSQDAYAALLGSAARRSRLAGLVEAVRVGETRFFRHAPQVQALVDVVIPAWRARQERAPRIWAWKAARRLRVYTLALVLARALRVHVQPFDPRHRRERRRPLAFAERATYPETVLGNVPEDYAGGFVREGKLVRVARAPRARALPEQQNTARPSNREAFTSCLWCRNVLIYFDAATRSRACSTSSSPRSSPAALFVGYSETLRDTIDGLRRSDTASRSHGKAWRFSFDTVLASAPSARAPRATLPPRSITAAPPTTSDAKAEPSPPSRTERSSPTKRDMRALRIAPASNDFAATISRALGERTLEELTIDLDAVDFASDDDATALRRLLTTARAAGVVVHLVATRPGHDAMAAAPSLRHGGTVTVSGGVEMWAEYIAAARADAATLANNWPACRRATSRARRVSRSGSRPARRRGGRGPARARDRADGRGRALPSPRERRRGPRRSNRAAREPGPLGRARRGARPRGRAPNSRVATGPHHRARSRRARRRVRRLLRRARPPIAQRRRPPPRSASPSPDSFGLQRSTTT
ncbi:MAG: CheR family methyltransferase [Polyangiaceae bacterium]